MIISRQACRHEGIHACIHLRARARLRAIVPERAPARPRVGPSSAPRGPSLGPQGGRRGRPPAIEDSCTVFTVISTICVTENHKTSMMIQLHVQSVILFQVKF